MSTWSNSFISKFYLGQAHVKRLEDGLLGPAMGVVLGQLVNPVKSICLWIRSVNSSNRFKRCLKETILEVKTLIISIGLVQKAGFYWSAIFPIQWPHVMPYSSCLKGGLQSPFENWNLQLIQLKVMFQSLILNQLIDICSLILKLWTKDYFLKPNCCYLHRGIKQYNSVTTTLSSTVIQAL